MNKKLLKKTVCTFLSMLLILSAFALTPVFASVENGNLAADVFDNHTDSSSLPSNWYWGNTSAVTVQNGVISINNEKTSDAVSVHVYSPSLTGDRTYSNSLPTESLVEFKARKNSNETTYFEMFGGGSGSGNSPMFRISFEADGLVRVHNCNTITNGQGGNYPLANAYNLNEFFTVKVYVVTPGERGTSRITVWINDNCVVDGAYFVNRSITSVKRGVFTVPAKTSDAGVNFEVADYFVRNRGIQSALDDATALDAAKELLTYRDLLGKSAVATAITSDLTLPTGVGVVNLLPGEDGTFTDDVAIEWTSDNEAVINPQTGAVVRPGIGEADVNVKLTATLTKGEAEPVSEEFNFVVKARSREEITALDNGNFVADVFDGYDAAAGLPDGWSLLSGAETSVTVNDGSVSITNEASAEDVAVKVDGVDANAFRTNLKVIDDAFIEFKVLKNSEQTSYYDMFGGSNETAMFRISFEEKGLVRVHNCRTVGNSRDGNYTLKNAYNLNEFFTVKIKNDYNADANTPNRISVWVNDKLVVKQAIYNSPTVKSLKYGKFVVPADESGAVSNMKIADYFIRSLNTQATLDNILATDAALELLTCRDLLGKNASASAITSDLTLPSGIGVVNPIPDDNGNVEKDVAIEWASDNAEVINPQTGAVTTPAIGEDPVNVKLTATIKKGAEAVSEDFDFVVKNPWSYTTDSEGNVSLTSVDEYVLTEDNAISVKTDIYFKESEGISFNIGGNNVVEFKYDNDGNFSYTDANGETVTKAVFTDDALYQEMSNLELVAYSNNTAVLLVNGDVVFENIPVTNASTASGNVAMTFLSAADENQTFDALKYESLNVSSNLIYQIDEDDVTVAPGIVSINTEGFYAPYGTDMYAAVYADGEITELLNVASLDAQKTGSTLSANLENAGAEGTTVKVFVWNGSDPITLPIIK